MVDLKVFLPKLTGKEVLALASIIAITILSVVLVARPSNFRIFGMAMFLVAGLGGFVWRDYRQKQRKSVSDNA